MPHEKSSTTVAVSREEFKNSKITDLELIWLQF